LLAALKARGYTGPWSLETFNPGYWKQDPEDIARRGKGAIDTLVA
jgi:sugar phosphate isomerase/epimerase